MLLPRWRLAPWWRAVVLGSLFVATGHTSAATLRPVFPFVDSSDRSLQDLTQSCDVDSVQVANIHQLHPILYDLVNTTFFRLFRVNLKKPSCAFWKSPEADAEAEHGEGATCTGSVPTKDPFGNPFGQSSSSFGQSSASAEEPAEPPCSIDAEEESTSGGSVDENSSLDDIDDLSDNLDRSMSFAERVASEARTAEGEAGCEFEEDLPTFWKDMCGNQEEDLEDVNLIKNPERNTGYNGSHIWEAMYNENCFEVGSGLPRGRFNVAVGSMSDGMCYEERVLYRLLSGWHASTTLSIAKNFYAPGTKVKGEWSPNLDKFMLALGQHPERVKNLHFSFVVMLRAIKKAGVHLVTYPYKTGNDAEDSVTTTLMSRLLDSQVLSLCSPLFDAFDETRLFRAFSSTEQRSLLKRQFKSVFRNITALVDCVQCQRCRLHAKLYTHGLGTALKILLTPPALIPSTTSRDDIVALVNVLWKLSEAMEDARVLTEAYWYARGGLPQPGSPPEKKPKPATSMPSTAANPQGVSAPGPVVVAPSGAPQVAFGAEVRRGFLDVAIGAVRQAASAGALSSAQEATVLRSLVAMPASDEVLLLAKHYAAERPELFAAVAYEAAVAASGRGSAAVVAGGSAPRTHGLLGSASSPADAVIIGGGLAGMVAAISLLDRGATVVLIEKQPYLGGNSGKASSGINAALETSVESLVADTTKSAGGLARPLLIEKLASDSAAAVDWLRKRTNVDLSMRSQLGGHTVKRTLRPANAFVGAEITFAAGQVLNKVAAERPDQFRILTKAKWSGLARGGAGWGATVSVNGTELVVEALSAVIASGGFGHDAKEAESLLLANRPDLADFPTTLGAQTTGDGVKIARDVGARLVDLDRVQLHPTGFVDAKKPQEHTKTLAAELLRGVGGLLLDRHGRRFTDELGTRQAVVNSELSATGAGGGLRAPAPVRTFALVLNSKAAAMADRHVMLYSKKGLLTKVAGLEGVAAHLNAPLANVRATFASYNEAAKAGKDEFNRTVFPAGHWPVDADEDFYVGWVVPVIHYTMGGIAIDADGRVLAANGDAIAGLYAIGEASGGVHGDNRLAGNSLLECTVFGRHVGLTLPRLPKSPPAAGAAGAAAGAAAAGAAGGPREAPRLLYDDGPEPSPAPPPAPKAQDKVSAQELSAHTTKDARTWVALYGQVYDLTDYVEEHPGGEEAILDVAGTEGTEHFEAVHNRELLESMGFEPIGTLSD